MAIRRSVCSAASLSIASARASAPARRDQRISSSPSESANARRAVSHRRLAAEDQSAAEFLPRGRSRLAEHLSDLVAVGRLGRFSGAAEIAEPLGAQPGRRVALVQSGVGPVAAPAVAGEFGSPLVRAQAGVCLSGGPG